MDTSPIYSLRVSEVFQALESSSNGLSSEEAQARRPLYGSNLLTAPARKATWPRLLAQLTHPMALSLLAAVAVAFLGRRPLLGVVILLLVIINAVFSFLREFRAEQAMESLRQLLPAYARLIRNGEEIRLPASEVVPGDILVLAEGDNIPADARVVEEYGLRTNNANLTGEAVPARRSADASLREGISDVERPNLVFAGTSVVSGTGRAVVYATGMLTQFGRIARLTQEVKEEASPLQKEMERLTRVILMVALGLGAIVMFVTFPPTGFKDFSLLLESFLLAVGIIVAVVPEGLPATLTLSLAMAGQRLATQGVLVKKLSVLETLGTISLICTDKSGTLTQNQMTVREIWVSRQRVRVTGVGYEPKGKFKPDPAGEPYEVDLKILLAAAALCNNSRLNPPTPDKPQWTSLGDQTEAALRVAAIKGGIDDQQLNVLAPRLHELPFDARRKRMATIHRDLHGEVAFIKGAPREVLGLCTHILIYGETRPLTSELRAEILKANDDYAHNALRVLALARRELPGEGQGARFRSVERVETDLTFLGLMAMLDPPRPEVAEAVRVCHQAGIKIRMITGDYGLTAESLARRVGLLTTPNPLILTGGELDELNDYELTEMLDQEIIFARMAPEHKLRLVSAFQARGEVIAVTGDGVNDVPAMRKADVGVAMGVTGTDVAKEASDVVLTNDNFSTIVTAINEGRAVFDNIRKFITYIFSSNVPEVLPFILVGLFYNPIFLTLNAQQILAIDLGTDLFPALALGAEKPEPDVMRRPPRRRSQPLIDSRLLARSFLWLGLIEAGLCYAGALLVRYGLAYAPLSQITTAWFGPRPLTDAQVDVLASTVFFAGVVTAQVGNAFACRTERLRGRALGWLSNRMLLISIAFEVVIVLALVYIPPLAHAFELSGLPPIYWLGLVLYGPVLYALDWLRKVFVRREVNRQQAAQPAEVQTH